MQSHHVEYVFNVNIISNTLTPLAHVTIAHIISFEILHLMKEVYILHAIQIHSEHSIAMPTYNHEIIAEKPYWNFINIVNYNIILHIEQSQEAAPIMGEELSLAVN